MLIEYTIDVTAFPLNLQFGKPLEFRVDFRIAVVPLSLCIRFKIELNRLGKVLHRIFRRISLSRRTGLEIDYDITVALLRN